MRILLTGATGFIGQYCHELLKKTHIHVTACSLKGASSVYSCNMLDFADMRYIIRHTRPTHLLHLAWYTGHNYAHDPANTVWLEASKELLHCFAHEGGKRFVGVGTCFEYPLDGEPCREKRLEDVQSIMPHTVYGQAKRCLREYVRNFASTQQLSWAWCIPFYVFGAQEHAKRLIPSAAQAFARHEDFITAAHERSMDYIDVRDVARILVHILVSDYCGAVNIGTGQGLLVKDMLSLLAQKFVTTHKAVPAHILDRTPPIVADVRILQSICGSLCFIPPQQTLNDYYEEYKNATECI